MASSRKPFYDVKSSLKSDGSISYHFSFEFTDKYVDEEDAKRQNEIITVPRINKILKDLGMNSTSIVLSPVMYEGPLDGLDIDILEQMDEYIALKELLQHVFEFGMFVGAAIKKNKGDNF